jgi:hypothetical protein
MDIPDVRFAPPDLDAQRDRAAGRVPDHATSWLCGEHRHRIASDHVGCAQVPRAGGAAGLLVADEVEDNPASVEQAELAGGGGAVEHRDQAALHVRGAASDDPPVVPFRLELRGALGRDHVEVPVVVDEAAVAAADSAAHDRRRFEAAGRRELDQLGREAEPVQRIVQDPRASPQPAAGRVLGGDTHKGFHHRGHLVGLLIEPVQDFAAAIAHVLSSPPSDSPQRGSWCPAWNLSPSVDDAEHAMLAMASGEWGEGEMVAWLREHLAEPENA